MVHANTYMCLLRADAVRIAHIYMCASAARCAARVLAARASCIYVLYYMLLWLLPLPVKGPHPAVPLLMLLMMTRLCYDVLHCDWTAWVTCHGWYMLTVWMLTAGALVLDVLRV